MLTFDDFEAGAVYPLGSVDVDEAEVLEFAGRFDPQPFHTDPVAAAETHFGGVVASGWHTCSMCMRLFVDGLLRDTTSMGSPGVDEIRWPHPVRPGDRLTGTYTVISTRASTSKPDRGIVNAVWELRNQDDVTVLTMHGMTMFARHPN